MPVGGEIIENKPILKLSCGLHPFCNYGKVIYACDIGVNTLEDNPSFIKLKNSIQYNGCNESTSGYQNGGILVDKCTCHFWYTG